MSESSSLPSTHSSVGQPTSALPARRVRQRRPHTNDSLEIHQLSDTAAWKYTDEEIIGIFLPTMSKTYNHYNIGLIRHTTDTSNHDSQQSEYMEFSYTCKSDPSRHPVQYRRRSDTHQGTSNLKTSLEACNRRNGQHSHSPDQPVSTPFSNAMHMAIMVMMCAYHYLPFAGVLHGLVRCHVELLRPGTWMPDSTTLSRATHLIYEQQANKVWSYFKDCGPIHLAVDGWTSPTATAYLGMVVGWYADGQIWRAALEMIRLEQKHTGQYLAQKISECLHRFGLEEKLLTMCMDNASNNDTLTRYLPSFIPGFLGPRSRVRCAAHVMNLVVKAFKAYFATPAPRKRKANVKIKSKRGSKRQRNTKSTARVTDPAETPEDVVIEAEINNHATLDSENGTIDPDKALHDEYVIKDTLEATAKISKDTLGIEITEATLTLAREILTKTSKLSKRVHEKPELKHKFDQAIDSVLPILKTDRRALARRNVTRWSSDYECLASHQDLRLCVEMLTGDESNDLQDLRLSDDQWCLLDQIIRVLKIFKEFTLFFSQGGVPLVHEVVPMFVTVRRKLELVHKDEKGTLNPLIRMAAHSSLLVLDKYMDMFEESDVYWIALVMCPDRKLQWLRSNNYSKSDVDTVRKLVTTRFYEVFGDDSHGKSVASVQVDGCESDDEWSLGECSKPESQAHGFDTIEQYLSTEPVASSIVTGSGGPLNYWQSQFTSGTRIDLSRFAIAYLTAPASSVDAERLFSCGRLTLNHLQHQMAPETFCAKMALRSWYGTPLMHGIDDAAAILGNANPV